MNLTITLTQEEYEMAILNYIEDEKGITISDLKVEIVDQTIYCTDIDKNKE